MVKMGEVIGCCGSFDWFVLGLSSGGSFFGSSGGLYGGSGFSSGGFGFGG